MLYKINNGAIELSGKMILEEINFEVHDKEKIGIVGRNGCGKSTLLKGMIGEVEFEQGIGDADFRIDKIGNVNMGYVSQNISYDINMLMIDYILLAYKDILDVEKKLEKLELEIANNYSEKVLNKFNELMDCYKYIGGYNYKKEYELALRKFGFKEEDKYKKLNEFSGGELTKLSFIKLLLSKPDLLLLDEPTNYLDIDTTIWLEEYLKNYSKSIILVSHDRMFLDNVCNVIYEIECGSLKRYNGNYSDYLRIKKEDYDRCLRNYEIQQKEIERLTKVAERFKYKPSKASMAMSKLKQIEHMVKFDKPLKENMRTFQAIFEPEFESYRDVLKVKNLAIGYDKILSYVNVNIERGTKLGIIGENGIGKSTFLKTLVGKIAPLSGKFIFGNKVKIGYFDQKMEDLDLENTVYEEIDKEFLRLSPKEIRNILGAFEFRGDDVFKKISDLSGGEKVRLCLCKILQHKPNLLILDEPTNHLDIVSKETIQKMLVSYKGTIIMVSHDRYLISKVCDSLLLFKKDGVSYYPFGYSNEVMKFSDSKKEDKSFGNKSLKKEKYVSPFKEKNKLERKLRKLEDEITDIEGQINLKNEEMLKEKVYLDIDEARRVQREIDDLNVKLDNKTKEWEDILFLLEG